ncbi:hypothetical protein C6P45_002201 [Maudiozyma exigua]|uniref:Uncharacterized protein n=1 Tax=Maudiozyma exigua TaxID=34358 RepID=A0A9P7B4M4_MAUEX|nr:hypothetical protein C6P45_002201 [Kazachstania exigua]
MILNVLSHTKIRTSCKYCDGVVLNCHCEFFKTLNENNIPLAGGTKNKLLHFEKLGTYTDWFSTIKISEEQRFLKKSDNKRRNGTSGSKNGRKNQKKRHGVNELELTHVSRYPQVAVPLENVLTRLNNNMIVFLILTDGLLREVRNNVFENLLGSYCPNRLRNRKFIDYNGTTYRKLQKSLAREKMLTQEEQQRQKLIYNPSNKHVFWALRPFNFDKEYSYLMFCNKALERKEPWRKYHDGLQKFPRRHLIRKWLNRKWEWETIIDYIFSELSPESNEISTVSGSFILAGTRQKVEKVNVTTFSEVVADDENGNTLTTTADVLQGAFEKSRGVVRRKANPLESDKIIHQKTPRSVHFHEKEDDDVVTSESGTIIRRLRLKKEDREIPQFQALLQDVLQEKEVQSTEVSVSDNWSFQESSYKTNETKYFYDIEANMSDSFDVPQDPKNYIMQSLFLDSPTNYAYEKDVGTKEMKVAETEKKQRNHRIRFWLNNSQDHSPKIQLLSYAGKQSDIYNI